MFCYSFSIVHGATLFSSVIRGNSSTLKAKISIFLEKAKGVCEPHQVHWVTHLQYQKQRLHSSCFAREFAQNQLNQDQRVFTWMCILFWVVFFPFESLRMGYEYSASGKILLSPLQNVKLKAIGGTQPFSLSNIELHWDREEKGSVFEEWKTWWRETEQVSFCLRKRATEHDRRMEWGSWLSNLGAICLHAACPSQRPTGPDYFPWQACCLQCSRWFTFRCGTDQHRILGAEQSKSKVWTLSLITNYRLDGEGWSFPRGGVSQASNQTKKRSQGHFHLW